MSLDELLAMLSNFTDEHYAKKDFQVFYRFLHRIALKGMGVGLGGDVESSGETAAMLHVREQLAKNYPGQVWNIFDVGANIGGFVASALTQFGTENRRYFCFEPSREAFAKLSESVKNDPSIAAFNFGMGNADATLPLFSNEAGSTLGSLYHRRLDHFGIAVNHVGDVQIKTLDGFVSDHNIDRIHYLKLDVEGNELKCLEGARKLLDEHRVDFIQFEFGGCNIDSRTYFQDFWYTLEQYKIKRILRDGLIDIERYTEAEEMFSTVNYLACLEK